jgi:hypothetical protein
MFPTGEAAEGSLVMVVLTSRARKGARSEEKEVCASIPEFDFISARTRRIALKKVKRGSLTQPLACAQL